MKSSSTRSLLLGDWSSMSALATAIRYEVFVVEQRVPVDIEIDEFDELATHVLVQGHDPDKTALATGRMVLTEGEFFSGTVGRIGRLAVRSPYRRTGIGQEILSALIQEGHKQGIRQFELHAQLAACALYERSGFVAQGDCFDEAGIAHVLMVRQD